MARVTETGLELDIEAACFAGRGEDAQPLRIMADNAAPHTQCNVMTAP